MINDPSNDGFFWKRQVSAEKIRYLEKHLVPGTVLDIGCGAGWYSHYLLEKGCAVHSIDSYQIPVQPSNIRFTRADAMKLPFPAHYFDVILLFDVLEHVQEDKDLLCEIKRVNRKRIFLSVPYGNDQILYPYGLSLLHHVDKTHFREYTEETLTEVVQSAGYSVKDISYSVAHQMPLVLGEFFSTSFPARVAKWVTMTWVRLLAMSGIIKNRLPGDIFCVAEAR